MRQPFASKLWKCLRQRVGVSLMIAVMAPTSCTGGGGQPPCECPAAFVSVVVLEPDGGQVDGVAGMLSGPTTVALTCTPTNGGIDCVSPSGFETVGTYTLTITAPGFREVDMTATVTVTHGSPSCACSFATLKPSTLTLEPS